MREGAAFNGDRLHEDRPPLEGETHGIPVTGPPPAATPLFGQRDVQGTGEPSYRFIMQIRASRDVAIEPTFPI